MRIIEWAFDQEVPTAEKLVLVYLAFNASSEGIGHLDRVNLASSTGYKNRSIQRLLKSLRDSGHLRNHGIWYVLGDINQDKKFEALEHLPEQPVQIVNSTDTVPVSTSIPVDTDAIAQAVGDHVIDQFANFEHRINESLARLATFHVEHEPEPEPPDPVIENPLYDQLLGGGMAITRAYALSKADLEMGEDTGPPVGDADGTALRSAWADLKMGKDTGHMPDYQQVFVDAGEDGYADDEPGRYERILDILHGSDAGDADGNALRSAWALIELQENKHTVKGEQAAFLLLYPQIVAAAKANVGKLSISDFCNAKRAAQGGAPWDQELSPVDKDDPALELEIGVMLAEIDATGNLQCQVQPRTTEKRDDGTVVQETLLGFHRRVRAKHNQMLQLKEMEIV